MAWWGWILIGIAIFLAVMMYICCIVVGRPDGTLQIDVRNPDKDIYRLKLDGAIEDLADKKRIVLVVDSKANLSD